MNAEWIGLNRTQQFIYEWKFSKNVEIGFLSSENLNKCSRTTHGQLITYHWMFFFCFRFVHSRFVEADRRILSDLLASEKMKHSLVRAIDRVETREY